MLKFGNSEIHSSKIGTSSISKIYLGDTLIFEYTSSENLGNYYDLMIRDNTGASSKYTATIEIKEYDITSNTYLDRTISMDVCMTPRDQLVGKFSEYSIINKIYMSSNDPNRFLSYNKSAGNADVLPFELKNDTTLYINEYLLGDNVKIRVSSSDINCSLVLDTNITDYEVFFWNDSTKYVYTNYIQTGDYYYTLPYFDTNENTINDNFSLSIGSSENEETLCVDYTTVNRIDGLISNYICRAIDFNFYVTSSSKEYLKSVSVYYEYTIMVINLDVLGYGSGYVSGYVVFNSKFGKFSIPINETFISTGSPVDWENSFSEKYLTDDLSVDEVNIQISYNNYNSPIYYEYYNFDRDNLILTLYFGSYH